MSLLREVEGQKKYRQEQEQDGNHKARKPLEERPHRPQTERLLQFMRRAQLECPVEEEVGITLKAEWKV